MGVNEKWYRKTPPCPNNKLRDAIIDVLPLDVDKKKAKEILLIIVEAMKEGVKRDGDMTIEGLGRFRVHKGKGRVGNRFVNYKGKLIYAGKRKDPDKSYVTFRACLGLRRAINKDNNA